MTFVVVDNINNIVTKGDIMKNVVVLAVKE